MEATQTVEHPSFESVWAGLQEVRQILKENAESLKESQKENERLRKESEADFNRRIGQWTNFFGEISEYLVVPKLCEKFTEFGFDFHKASQNIKVKDKDNNIFLEVDVLLEDGDKAVLVEVKTKLTVERVNKHIERLEKTRAYANSRGDNRMFLGAVAGVVIADEARNYALDQGFYVIEPSGQNFNITPPNGKPKEW
jgi:ribosomal protein S17